MYTQAFSTLGCGELSLDEVFALADGHRIPLIELRALAGTIDLPEYLAQTYGSPAALASRLGARRTRIVALDTSFRLIDGTVTDRDRLLAFVPWAEALGVRWLRVFDGGRQIDGDALAAAAAALGWWQAIRRERGLAVDLMIETHDLLLESATIRRFIAAMPPGSVSLLWDTHHTWRRGAEDPLATWAAVGRHVVHAHVKDSVAAPAAPGFTYVLPGAGEFPMAALRRVLAEEFSGALSLEWERFWLPQLGPLHEALGAAATNRWW